MFRNLCLLAMLGCMVPLQAQALGDNERLALSFFAGKLYGERHQDAYRYHHRPAPVRHYHYYHQPPQYYNQYHYPPTIPSYSTSRGSQCPPGYGLVLKQEGGYITTVGCRRL